MSMLANYWCENAVSITVITVDSESTDFYRLDPRIHRVALNMMQDSTSFLSAITNNYKRIWMIRKALRRAAPKTVLSFEDRTNVLVLLAASFLGIRRIACERTDPAHQQVGLSWQILRRLTYRYADALVVQTESLLPWARAIVGAERAHVIANPVRDMRRFARLHRQQSDHFALAVGRLDRAKGFDMLLAAFARIAAEFPNWRLVILGEGPERRSLSALAQRLGIAERISMPGQVAEPGDFMSAASLFVMTSRYEGFPNALLEAMACGLATLSSACRGPAEIVNPEVDGVLVPVDEEIELAAAMARLMRDSSLREALGRSAQSVRERYALAEIASRWETLLRTDQVSQVPA